MKNRITRLAFYSLVTVLIVGCNGIPTLESGSVAGKGASNLIHNQPLIVKSTTMPNSTASVVLTDPREDDNVSQQISCETQQSTTILEVPLPQDEIPPEKVTDSPDSNCTDLVKSNEEILQIASAPRVGCRTPEFEVMWDDGTTSNICDLNRPVLLNFWNSGCKPCRDEMPYLQKVYDERGDEGLLVLAINIGENPTSIRSFMEENDFHIPVLFDVNAAIARQYQVRYLPTSFFVDTDCIIQEKVIGSFTSEAAIEQNIVNIMP